MADAKARLDEARSAYELASGKFMQARNDANDHRQMAGSLARELDTVRAKLKRLSSVLV